MWLRLVRDGDRLTAYESTDGGNWTTIATGSIDLPGSIFVGLAVTRGAGTSGVGAMDNVRVSAAPANLAPTVSLTSPSSGQIVMQGATLVMTATASDDDLVEAVEFLVDGRRVGIDTAAPYSGTWRATETGLHTVSALARDSEGAVARSARVTVVVRPRGGGGGGDDDDDDDDDDDGPVPPGRGPWRLVFEPSLDHDRLVDRYTLEIYSLERSVLVASRDLGRPPLVDGESTVDLTPQIWPLRAGRYQVVVRAIDDSTGARSIGASTTFQR